VPQDSARAASFYLQAAELGDPLAQFNVAQRYELGRGVSTNLTESWKWYELARAGGVADALRARQTVESRLTPEQLREARRALDQFRCHATEPKEHTP
jgi:localization factor PodJL